MIAMQMTWFVESTASNASNRYNEKLGNNEVVKSLNCELMFDN
jgi:hypothetical protein